MFARVFWNCPTDGDSGDFSAYVRLAMHCPAGPGGKALLFVMAAERYHKKKLRKREWQQFLM